MAGRFIFFKLFCCVNIYFVINFFLKVLLTELFEAHAESEFQNQTLAAGS